MCRAICARQLTPTRKKPTIPLVQEFRKHKAWQRSLILALALHFLLGLAMTASPWLHERLHHEANDDHARMSGGGNAFRRH